MYSLKEYIIFQKKMETRMKHISKNMEKGKKDAIQK